MKREATSHTKMKLLSRKLRLPLYSCVGIMELLWHLTAREAPQGDIGKLSNESIAIGIDYEGDADALVAVLQECGWLEQSEGHRLVIHDWSEHSDDTVDNKLARAGKYYADGRLPRMTKLSIRERETLLNEKFGTSEFPETQKATTQHEEPLPGAVPEPFVSSPPERESETSLGGHSPDASSELAQAAKLLDALAVPSDRSTKQVVADALHQHAKEVGGAEQAFQSILEAAEAAKLRGTTINRFWFSDQKYRKSLQKETANGTHRSATHARVSDNKQALAAALARRLSGSSDLAAGADGRPVSEPGPRRLDGGVPVGLRTIGTPVLAG